MISESEEQDRTHEPITQNMSADGIIVYPAFDAFYYSFYLQGLFDVFGESKVVFSYHDFPVLPANILSFIVKVGDGSRG